MPSTTVGREQSAEAHLVAAADWIAVAESDERKAKRLAYEHAADEIVAAQKDNPTLSFSEIDRRWRRSKSGQYSGSLVRWRTNPSAQSNPDSLPFERDPADSHPLRQRREVEKVARERPDEFAEAFRQAPPEAREKIAKRLAESSPEVRIAARQRDVEQSERRKPSPVAARGDHMLFQWDSKIATAARVLHEGLALLGELDQPGDDEDRLDALRRLRELVAANEEAYRTGKSIDTWAAELHERSGTDG